MPVENTLTGDGSDYARLSALMSINTFWSLHIFRLVPCKVADIISLVIIVLPIGVSMLCTLLSFITGAGA